MLKFTKKLRLATKFVLSLGSILTVIFAICAAVILSQSASVKENVNSRIAAVIQQQDKSDSSVTINELSSIIDETMDLVAIEVVGIMFMASAGDGDLQRRIDVKGSDGIDVLGRIFNGFIEKLQNIMSQVMSDSANLVGVASHLSNISASSSDSALQQQTQIEQVLPQ